MDKIKQISKILSGVNMDHLESYSTQVSLDHERDKLLKEQKYKMEEKSRLMKESNQLHEKVNFDKVHVEDFDKKVRNMKAKIDIIENDISIIKLDLFRLNEEIKSHSRRVYFRKMKSLVDKCTRVGEV